MLLNDDLYQQLKYGLDENSQSDIHMIHHDSYTMRNQTEKQNSEVYLYSVHIVQKMFWQSRPSFDYAIAFLDYSWDGQSQCASWREAMKS